MSNMLNECLAFSIAAILTFQVGRASQAAHLADLPEQLRLICYAWAQPEGQDTLYSYTFDAFVTQSKSGEMAILGTPSVSLQESLPDGNAQDHLTRSRAIVDNQEAQAALTYRVPEALFGLSMSVGKTGDTLTTHHFLAKEARLVTSQGSRCHTEAID